MNRSDRSAAALACRYHAVLMEHEHFVQVHPKMEPLITDVMKRIYGPRVFDYDREITRDHAMLMLALAGDVLSG